MIISYVDSRRTMSIGIIHIWLMNEQCNHACCGEHPLRNTGYCYGELQLILDAQESYTEYVFV
jgi:hypothetical protein